ncbi:MOSC domain-containing protein [Neoroseomonas oryzicola]|uniref:MOSC domain-containing protein n=1 Tax=Neoroseomonas oryzicola TaxID=535904 RepID=A0A9X9WQ29_9PROT|nr:MOSC domain-containing protein [Neoroseomonas oryzicola]MBR0662439.1 MOSC domain-containing protein [Neoroseomonas oryzicola]NKE20118.1 MOSC domain-containing protein [Neoroseomonas oryzicola]
MRIETIYRYPVKGLTAEAMEDVLLTAGETLPHDRRFALAQGDSAFDPAAPSWLPKRNFACLMVNARLALAHSAFDARTGELAIRIPGAGLFLGDTRTPEGRTAIAAHLTAFLGEEARGTPRFLEAPGHSFSDVAKKVVSIIGLSSLHALEQATGTTLDPLRFRANVYVSGGSPWAEFDWIGREILLGQARLRIVKRIVRCPATEVNPATGERDAEPPRWLRQHFGHADLGVYAEVIEGGRISTGDTLQLHEDDAP